MTPTNSSTYPKPVTESLKQAVRELIGAGGVAYTEIPHPDFATWPTKRVAADRRAVIEPHLEYQGGTALDIGAYLGAFSHWLEDLGYRVTAVERNKQCVAVAKELRDLAGKKFEIENRSYHKLSAMKYDVVLALNVFHQSLRRPETFAQLAEFLPRLDCRLMIFESHDPSAAVAGVPEMTPEEFVRFIGDKSGLSDIQAIGMDGPRKLFKLRHPLDGAAGRQIPKASSEKAPATIVGSPPSRAPKPAAKRNAPGPAKPPITVAALALILDGGVEQLVGEKLGCPVKHTGKKEHIRPKVLESKRRYFRHVLETVEEKPRQVIVFSKSGIGAPEYLRQVESVLSDGKLDGFRAPHFYGIADLAQGQREGRVGVWECVTGNTFPVTQASREVLSQLVQAAASIETLSEGARRRVTKLRDRVKFLKPLAIGVEATLSMLDGTGVDVESLRPMADAFAANEDRVLARLRDIGNTALCHMDFGNGNVLFPDDEALPVVIDWETVCLGPPGSTMRKLALVDENVHPELAQLYVDTLRRLGESGNVNDVLFAMRATQVYYSLDWACRRGAQDAQGAEHAIRWSLSRRHYLGLP